MSFLDVRTVIFSHLITDAACAGVLVLLWAQNRRRFSGTSFWVADFGCQTAGVLLIVLRGSIPDWISIGFSSVLTVGGALLGYFGLVRFVGKRGSQIHNFVLLALFLLVHAYFTFVRPSLEARNLNVSLGLLVVCFQCAWLMLNQVGSASRQKTRGVGIVFGLFCLVSLIRVFVTLAVPPQSNDFFRSGLYDTFLLMGYQVLLILLTFSLVLLVNNHLIGEAQSQEEKFTKAFHSSPYAITLTRPSDGRILEVNEGFVKITGYTYAEVVGRTTAELHLWVRDEDRADVVAELSQGKSVQGREFEFRKKSGEELTGLFSAEVMTIHDQTWILSSISDISERKLYESELKDSEMRLHLALDAAQGGVWEWDLDTNENFWSDELWKVYGLEPHSHQPSYETWLQTIHPDDREGASLAVQEAARSGSELNAEWRVCDPDGRERWLMSRGRPVRDTSGRAVRYIGTVLDITERKQAESNINSLARFPSENPNPTLRLARDGTILYANPSSRDLLADWKSAAGKRAPGSWRKIAARALGEEKTTAVEVQCGERTYSFSVVPVVQEKYVNLYGREVTEQKQAEKTLVEGERRYRSLFENMLNGFAYCQMLFENGHPDDFIYLEVNEAFERLTGLKEVAGRKVSEVIPGLRQSAPELFETYGRVSLSGQPEIFETYVEALKMWFSISVYSPQKEYFVAVFDVITERKQMEAALRENETNFRALAENAGEGILIAGAGGVHLFANQAMAEISGYGVDELLNLRAQELSDPQEAAKILERLRKRLGGDPVPSRYETAIVHKDGRKVPVQISSSETAWKGQPADIVFVQDITERKRAEGALQASEARYRRLFEAAKDGILILNADTGQVVDVNPFLVKLLGYSHETFMGKELWQLGLFKNIAASREAFLELQSKQYIRFEDLPLETADGRHIEVEFISNVYTVDHTKVVQCNIRDISERARDQRELERQREELTRSNSDLEQFAYVASHDLQEPLRMVSSYMQLLERRYKGKLDQNADEFIGFAVDGAERMQRLINDLLAYSRVGTHGQPFAAVSCSDALEQALANLQIMVTENKAKISHDPLPQVMGDVGQLVQLFQNLVGNAVKFHGEKAPRVRVSVESGEKEWVFSVKDNGIGLDPQYAERIFIIFQRLHDRGRYAGTGIGLAICKKIVQRHGGRIWVESKPGKGATFYFTLPK